MKSRFSLTATLFLFLSLILCAHTGNMPPQVSAFLANKQASLDDLYKYREDLKDLLRDLDEEIKTSEEERNERQKRFADNEEIVESTSLNPVDAFLNSNLTYDLFNATFDSEEIEQFLDDNSASQESVVDTTDIVSPPSANTDDYDEASTSTESPSTSSTSQPTISTTEQSATGSREQKASVLATDNVYRRPSHYMNITDECQRLTQDELVNELKQRGTYNPDFMAWDVPGVIRFLDRATFDNYDREKKQKDEDPDVAVQRNLHALERILKELDVPCDVRSAGTIARLYNLTTSRNPRSLEHLERLRRQKRQSYGKGFSPYDRNKYLYNLYRGPDPPKSSTRRGRPTIPPGPNHVPNEPQGENELVGQVHIVPFGCSKRGSEEDGYLRLCGACQAIRRLPDDFFPPFINEILCDEDKACLYFYDYPHGKCKQKHMSFVVLRNVGTRQCQIWRKFNLNVRVSCECFVDEMSFFAKYV